MFDPATTEKQCKRLVGNNINFKVKFVSTIQAVTTEACTIAIIFGTQSVILELDEGEINEKEKENMQYKT